jgi:hypothetical protein
MPYPPLVTHYCKKFHEAALFATTNVIAKLALACYTLHSTLWSCSLWLITSRFSRRFSLHSALVLVASACCSDNLAMVSPLAYERTLA